MCIISLIHKFNKTNIYKYITHNMILTFQVGSSHDFTTIGSEIYVYLCILNDTSLIKYQHKIFHQLLRSLTIFFFPRNFNNMLRNLYHNFCNTKFIV